MTKGKIIGIAIAVLALAAAVWWWFRRRAAAALPPGSTVAGDRMQGDWITNAAVNTINAGVSYLDSPTSPASAIVGATGSPALGLLSKSQQLQVATQRHMLPEQVDCKALARANPAAFRASRPAQCVGVTV